MVEYKVTDQAIDELGNALGELGWLCGELFEALGQPVAGCHVLPIQGSEQLDLVIPGEAERGTVGHHAHCEPEHRRRGRSPVDQITEKEHSAAHRDVAPMSLREIPRSQAGSVVRQARYDNHGHLR